MELDRILEDKNLFIGSALTLSRPALLAQNNITHVLSILEYSPAEKDAHCSNLNHAITRMYIDVDDIEEADLLVHFPRIVRFIDDGLRPKDCPVNPPTATPVPHSTAAQDGSHNCEAKGGSVYVHCAMGKSRSAAAVVAYLLWKYPKRFDGGHPPIPPIRQDDIIRVVASDPASSAAPTAVQRALAIVREARPIVEPNQGFMRQLELWWRLGCPADTDDAVERHPAYQHWLYQKEVQESIALGRAPSHLWFSDETRAVATGKGSEGDDSMRANTPPVQLRCKICRRVLAESQFILPHNHPIPTAPAAEGCPHYFVEPLSWMRPILQEGELDGRLACPNPKCGASVGRYSWKGFKCTCWGWVCPAFSLHKSKVDRVLCTDRKADDSVNIVTTAPPLNIRLPPGSRMASKVENL